jgi:tetratricopeptide (TPR) repeat protein
MRKTLSRRVSVWLQQSKDAEALESFREALNADPSNEEAFELWKRTEQRIWSYMLAKGGEYEKIARSLLSRATIARKTMSSDASTIQALVEDAIRGDAAARRKANFALASNHGAFAVPFLVDALGNPDETSSQVYAILTCEAIGRNATLPLIQLLESGNKTLRLNAAMALSYIGDSRAVPALLRLAQSNKEDVGVREIASRAAAKMNAESGSALDAYLAHANDYLLGNPLLLRDGDIAEVVWSFEDGELKHRKVPAQLFALELAKDSAYGALRVDPNSSDALVKLSQVYLAQQTIVRDTLAKNPGNEEMNQVQEAMGELSITVLAAGPKVLRSAVEASVKSGMTPAAVSGMHKLATVEDPKDLTGSPLLAGLESDDKRVRYASALSLSEMNAKLTDAQRKMLVDTLSTAVLERSVRIVRYLDENPSTHGVAMEASSDKKGYFVNASAKTDKFLADIRLFPNVDVIVFNENMERYTAQDLVRWVRQTSALDKTKIVVVSNDVDKTQETLGDKVDGIIAGPINSETLRAEVDKVLEGAELNENDQRANEMAVSAAEALARLDPRNFDVASASANLNEAARRQAAVAIPALKALGRSASNDLIPALLDNMARGETDESVRVAIAAAIGEIMGRTGELNSKAVEMLKGIAMDRGQSAQLRSAAVGALGKSPISASERAELFRKLRVNPSSGSIDG